MAFIAGRTVRRIEWFSDGNERARAVAGDTTFCPDHPETLEAALNVRLLVTVAGAVAEAIARDRVPSIHDLEDTSYCEQDLAQARGTAEMRIQQTEGDEGFEAARDAMISDAIAEATAELTGGKFPAFLDQIASVLVARRAAGDNPVLLESYEFEEIVEAIEPRWRIGGDPILPHA